MPSLLIHKLWTFKNYFHEIMLTLSKFHYLYNIIPHNLIYISEKSYYIEWKSTKQIINPGKRNVVTVLKVTEITNNIYYSTSTALGPLFQSQDSVIMWLSIENFSNSIYAKPRLNKDNKSKPRNTSTILYLI